MYNNIEEITKNIVKNSDLSESKIEKMIEEKEAEFSGLISKEGAAHIVAKELGVNLLKNAENKEIKIKDLLPGMSNVTILGKVTKIFEPREFEKDGKKGKVVNIILGDETGQTRMSLWNEQVNAVEDDKIKEENVMEISNAYVKGDNTGRSELRLGREGKLKKSKKKIKVKKGSSLGQPQKIKLNDISTGIFAEIRGSMVQFFESNPFYYVCPECGKKLNEGKCNEHGEVKAKPVMVINGVIDDGYGNIRVVFFREQAEKILGIETEEAFKMTEEGKNLKPLRDRIEERLGSEFKVKGRSKLNNFFERIELIANEVSEVDPEEEAKAILNNLEDKK